MSERRRNRSGRKGLKKGVPAQTTEVTPQVTTDPNIAPLTPSPPQSHGRSLERPGIQAPRPQAVRSRQTSNNLGRAVFIDIDPEFQELLLILPFSESRDQLHESFFHAGISTVRQLMTATDETILALSMPRRRQREPIPKFQVRLILQLRRFVSSYVEYYNGLVDIAIYTEEEFLHFCRWCYQNNISGQSVSYKALDLLNCAWQYQPVSVSYESTSKNYTHTATQTRNIRSSTSNTRIHPTICERSTEMKIPKKKILKTKAPTELSPMTQTRSKTETPKTKHSETSTTAPVPVIYIPTREPPNTLQTKTFEDTKTTKMTASIRSKQSMVAPNSKARIPTKKAPKNRGYPEASFVPFDITPNDNNSVAPSTSDIPPVRRVLKTKDKRQVAANDRRISKHNRRIQTPLPIRHLEPLSNHTRHDVAANETTRTKEIHADGRSYEDNPRLLRSGESTARATEIRTTEKTPKQEDRKGRNKGQTERMKHTRPKTETPKTKASTQSVYIDNQDPDSRHLPLPILPVTRDHVTYIDVLDPEDQPLTLPILPVRRVHDRHDVAANENARTFERATNQGTKQGPKRDQAHVFVSNNNSGNSTSNNASNIRKDLAEASIIRTDTATDNSDRCTSIANDKDMRTEPLSILKEWKHEEEEERQHEDRSLDLPPHIWPPPSPTLDPTFIFSGTHSFRDNAPAGKHGIDEFPLLSRVPGLTRTGHGNLFRGQVHGENLSSFFDQRGNHVKVDIESLQNNARTKDTTHHIRPPPTTTSFKFSAYGERATENNANTLNTTGTATCIDQSSLHTDKCAGNTQDNRVKQQPVTASGADVLPPSGRPPGSVAKEVDALPATGSSSGLQDNGEDLQNCFDTATEDLENVTERAYLRNHVKRENATRKLAGYPTRNAAPNIDKNDALPPSGRSPGSAENGENLPDLFDTKDSTTATATRKTAGRSTRNDSNVTATASSVVSIDKIVVLPTTGHSPGLVHNSNACKIVNMFGMNTTGTEDTCVDDIKHNEIDTLPPTGRPPRSLQNGENPTRNPKDFAAGYSTRCNDEIVIDKISNIVSIDKTDVLPATARPPGFLRDSDFVDENRNIEGSSTRQDNTNTIPPTGRPPGHAEHGETHSNDILEYGKSYRKYKDDTEGDIVQMLYTPTVYKVTQKQTVGLAENGEITARRPDLVSHIEGYLALKSKSATNGIDELPPPGRPPGSNHKNDRLTTLGNLIYTWGACRKTRRRVECLIKRNEVAYGNEESKDQDYKGSKEGETQIHIKRRYAFLI